MAIARVKFNPNTPKIVNRDMSFGDISYKIGDNFDMTDVTPILAKRLYNSHRINDKTETTSKKVKKTSKKVASKKDVKNKPTQEGSKVKSWDM